MSFSRSDVYQFGNLINVLRPALGDTAIAISLGLTIVGTAHAQTDWRAPRVVVQECAGCHGIDGNSQWPVMPRLAGQNAAYIAQQIAAFQAAPAPPSVQIPEWLAKPPSAPADARTGPDAKTYMIGPAHALIAEDVKAATDWYARQSPAPGMPGEASQVAKGRELYAKGDPAAGIIACQDCHGANAVGLATFPRLAGQHASYIVRQLRAFVTGERPLGSPMHRIAKSVSTEDAEALAAYLQSL